MVRVQQVLHDFSVDSSGGRSALRKVRPNSRASRKAGSSEIEPVTRSSQLGEAVASASRCWRSATARSRSSKRCSRTASFSMVSSQRKAGRCDFVRVAFGPHPGEPLLQAVYLVLALAGKRHPTGLRPQREMLEPHRRPLGRGAVIDDAVDGANGLQDGSTAAYLLEPDGTVKPILKSGQVTELGKITL